MKNGGRLLAECLVAQGVERLFCVPGESYLPVLDALADTNIDTVVARHEGGAAMMAEADGKLCGRPGVCFVTRAPGAANAVAGVYVAAHDSTPLALFVGQVSRPHWGRGAFQETNYEKLFGGMAKRVFSVDDARRLPEIISRAWHIAMADRPGPVVLALPEDMLEENTDGISAPPRVESPTPSPTANDIKTFLALIKKAKRPLIIVGGSRWTAKARRDLQSFSEKWHLPVVCSFRRQDLFDNAHPHYAGDLGFWLNPKLKARLAASDFILLIGGRLSEVPSQGFTLLDIPRPKQTLVHVHPGAEELGRVYTPDLAVNTAPEEFLSAVLKTSAKTAWAARTKTANADYRRWTKPPPAITASGVDMSEIIIYLRDTVAANAIITNGAGNYSAWVHRYYRYQKAHTQLAPTSGSMGYGLPAAIAAKLREPQREVICFAGDGCLQMTMQELGTACQHNAAVIVIVVDNGMYGTILMHQIRRPGGRVFATHLKNPDFAAIARAYGAHGETVKDGKSFPAAFARAKKSAKPALIHIKTNPELIAPSLTLSQIAKR